MTERTATAWSSATLLVMAALGAVTMAGLAFNQVWGSASDALSGLFFGAGAGLLTAVPGAVMGAIAALPICALYWASVAIAEARR
ncbi:protein of unknown function [Methylorubrum extorquens]|uniref:Uncharacterized protein n=1 Tax=Methylorubrum extorquens TaxID=408 RepID=A0A2N9ATL7_METEX|nr:protein of unknown function [Methylorubrum extorquens]